MSKPNPMPVFSEINAEITRNSFNVAEQFKNLPLEEIQQYQADISKPWHIMCLNITGDLNVGVIGRSGAAFGCSSMWTVGRRKIDRRSFVGIEQYMPVHRVDADLPDLQVDVNVIRQIFTENNLIPIFVEQGGDTLGSFNWQETFQTIAADDCRPIFVFGNEGIGIQDDILALRNEFNGSKIVSINQIGVTRSLNVASCATTILWHFSNSMGWI